MHTICHQNKNIVRFLGLTKGKKKSLFLYASIIYDVIYVNIFFFAEEVTETSYLMVFEYANRNNLRMFLKSEKLEWDMRLKLSLDISKGLSHLHSLNIAHRDLVS
jgi:serine/threonine protein kinase